MEESQLQKLAVGGAVVGIVVALASGRLPRWLRVVLVAAVLALACGGGLFAYRYVTKPVTLTIAAGSVDADGPMLLSVLATRLASTNAPVRLKIIDKGTVLEAAKAFSAGEADLALVRGDLGDLSAARTVVLATHVVALVVVPPGGSIDSIDGLKGKTVGVVGGGTNHQVVQALTKEYDLERAKVHFKDLAIAEAAQAIKSKQVSALLVVMPISEKYLSMLRDFFPRNDKKQIGLIAIESAGAIAAVARAYESFDLPKGTVRGSPAIPDDDLTTLRVPVYIVADKKLDNDAVTALTRAIMESRRELIGAYPIFAQVAAPSTDKDAFIPIHPGAAAYFDGDQKTIFDKYGDQFFYGSMLLGSLASMFAAAWKFMTRKAEEEHERPLNRLYALSDRIAAAPGEAELMEVERSIDEILRSVLPKTATGDEDGTDTAALALATHRLEHLIVCRRRALDGKAAPAPQA